MKLQDKKNIDKLINKVLNETLQSKADTLETKLKKGLEEDLGGMEDNHPTFGEFTPEDMEKYLKKHFKKHSKSEKNNEPFVKPTSTEDEDWNMGDIFEDKTTCDECGGMIYEGECNECGWKSNMNEEEIGHFPKYQEFDYVAEDDSMMEKVIKVCREEGKNSEGCKKHMEYAGVSSEELSEELHGNQHKLDVAEPKGVLNKKDFQNLRQWISSYSFVQVFENLFY